MWLLEQINPIGLWGSTVAKIAFNSVQVSSPSELLKMSTEKGKSCWATQAEISRRNLKMEKNTSNNLPMLEKSPKKRRVGNIPSKKRQRAQWLGWDGAIPLGYKLEIIHGEKELLKSLGKEFFWICTLPWAGPGRNTERSSIDGFTKATAYVEHSKDTEHRNQNLYLVSALMLLFESIPANTCPVPHKLLQRTVRNHLWCFILPGALLRATPQLSQPKMMCEEGWQMCREGV